MRRILFLLTLSLYAWSVLEMHEWMHVPTVVVHLLEHHSDLGHHDEGGAHHTHADLPADEHDHSPFDEGCADELCACGGVAVIPMRQTVRLSAPSAAVELAGAEVLASLATYQGAKWNPPKRG